MPGETCNCPSLYLCRAAQEWWIWSLTYVVSSVSELRLQVLCKELGEACKDNRAAFEIEKCFVNVGKSLIQAVEEMFKNILPY